jgi:Protein of unknown function (DUF2911)
MPTMKPLSALRVGLLCSIAATTLHGQGALRPEPSGRGSSEVHLGVPQSDAKPLSIKLDYGQPHLRGRTLHTDSLVPYDKPWRMGANENTTLTTEVDLVLGGATLPKGSYVLYTIPGRNTWKLVIQRSVGQPAIVYSDSNDVARIDLRHTNLTSPIESFTMWLIPSTTPGPGRGELRLAWGTDQLSADWSVK